MTLNRKDDEMKPVKLDEIFESIVLQSEIILSFLDRETGIVFSIDEEDLRLAESLSDDDLSAYPEWKQNNVRRAMDLIRSDGSGRYLRLPASYEIHEYQIMEEFIESLKNEFIRDALSHAIRGRGAFRRFKDAVIDYGVASEWYDYRDKALRLIAIEWCWKNNVPFTE